MPEGSSHVKNSNQNEGKKELDGEIKGIMKKLLEVL